MTVTTTDADPVGLPAFDGLDPDAVGLLDQLPSWDADRYAAEKDRLVAGLTRPAAVLIARIADRLDADLTTSRGSVSPLHRDLRFAAAGTPRYKDHLLLTTWEGRDKKSAPVLWVRVDAHSVGFASGIAFTPQVRDRWRAAVGDARGEALAGALARLRRDRGADVAGDELKRVPTPFGADHPRADLLRRTGFQVRFRDDLPDEVAEPAFVDWCVTRLHDLLPVHRWLVAEVTPG